MHKVHHRRPRDSDVNGTVPEALQRKDEGRDKLKAEDGVVGIDEAIYAVYC